MEERSAKRAARPKRVVGAGLPKGMKVGQFIQQEMQRFLLAQDHRSKDPKTHLQTMIEAGHRRAVDMRSGQGKAITELFLAYAFEKPKPAEDELQAMEKSGLQVVYINHPELADVPKQKELLKPEPKFLEGEVIEEDSQ